MFKNYYVTLSSPSKWSPWAAIQRFQRVSMLCNNSGTLQFECLSVPLVTATSIPIMDLKWVLLTINFALESKKSRKMTYRANKLSVATK